MHTDNDPILGDTVLAERGRHTVLGSIVRVFNDGESYTIDCEGECFNVWAEECSLEQVGIQLVEWSV